MSLNTKMTDEETERYINEMYPKVKTLLDVAGMTKEQWIEEIKRGPQKQFRRCENCRDWPCDSIERLKEHYPLFVDVWYGYGNACHMFNPKEVE